MPNTVQRIAVLDRTKEPGSIGEPLYLDVRTAIGEAMEDGRSAFEKYPLIVGGRYGLGSKDFTPGMVKAVFDNLDAGKPKRGFSVGIIDDVTGLSLDVDEGFEISDEGYYSAMFYGLGSDGTVGANHNSIKIGGHPQSTHWNRINNLIISTLVRYCLLCQGCAHNPRTDAVHRDVRLRQLDCKTL